MSTDQIAKTEELVNLIDRWGDSEYYEGTFETQCNLIDHLAAVTGQETPEDYDDDQYAQLQAVGFILQGIRFFKNKAQTGVTETLVQAQKVAQRAAIELGTLFEGADESFMTDIALLLSGKEPTDLSAAEWEIYERVGTAMIVSYLLRG